jgi:hypothetical protein
MKYTAFLCGAFASGQSFVPDSSWKRVTLTEQERSMSGNFYYPEFVAFNFGPATNSITRFVKEINRQVSVNVGYGQNVRLVDVSVAEVSYYNAPFGLDMYSVRINIIADPNDITAVVSTLRNLNFIVPGNSEFASLALDPLLEIYRKSALNAKECSSYGSLVEFGNKLKVFQIAVEDDQSWNEESSDILLFEMGTLSPVGSSSSNSANGSSGSYIKKVMDEGKVSVFNNWKALSLFDTFTMLGHCIPDSIVDNWVANYFGMLYISELYIKFYLFRLNNDFRLNYKSADKLLEQFDEFDYGCWFDNVSYNFLPRLIHRSMEQGLDIISEKQRLYEMMARQNGNREKRDDQKMNNLLFYLTLFTTFSMVWDASSLFNEMYPFETYIGSNITGFRMVSYTLLLIIFIMIMAVRFKRK